MTKEEYIAERFYTLSDEIKCIRGMIFSCRGIMPREEKRLALMLRNKERELRELENVK